MTLVHLLLIGFGGFFGAISRYSVSKFINQRFSFTLPIATLLINLTGSFLLGLMIGSEINESAMLLLGTGFMGAFTTFSTFTLEGIQLYYANRKKLFLFYTIISYGLGILLAFWGIEIGQFT